MPDAALRPGGFRQGAGSQTGDNQKALLVPQPAVVEVQSQCQLIVLTPDNKATFRPVKMGERVSRTGSSVKYLKPASVW